MPGPHNASYQRGFADSQRDQARLVLQVHADGLELAASRLSTTAEAVAAINEAVAILRDAAVLSDPSVPDPEPGPHSTIVTDGGVDDEPEPDPEPDKKRTRKAAARA